MFALRNTKYHVRLLLIGEFSFIRHASLCDAKGKLTHPSFTTILPSGQVYIKDKHKHFIDSLRMKVSGGSGGNGYPKYDGLGGNGGNVILVAKDKLTLKVVKQSKQYRKGYRAGDGEHSSHYSILGKNGKDLEIEVPTGVSVVLDDYKRTITDLNKQDDQVTVALGGRGGDPTNSFCGTKGQRTLVRLDLKMIADVGLVGFPNAGKSTLLRSLSRASPKIASYPFTTIKPNIGIIEFANSSKGLQLYNEKSDNLRSTPKFYHEDSRQISVADLPGLIEGAHRNVGMGYQFLKHIVRTNLLLFVVDIDGFKNVGGIDYHESWTSKEPIQVIQTLVNELDLYDPKILQTKPSILVITKLDTGEHRNRFNQLVENLRNTQITVPSKEEALKVIRESVGESQESHGDDTNETESEPFRFDKIVGVSSIKAYNTERLKGVIRRLIDIDAESKQNNVSFKQLVAEQRPNLIDIGDDDEIVDNNNNDDQQHQSVREN